MKHRSFLKYLQSQAFITFEERTKHIMVFNEENGKSITIPRKHNKELKKPMAIAICKQLGIPRPPSYK